MNEELKKEVMECLALAWEKAANHELLTFEETNRLRAALASLENAEAVATASTKHRNH